MSPTDALLLFLGFVIFRALAVACLTGRRKFPWPPKRR